jgi:hypothetical protein
MSNQGTALNIDHILYQILCDGSYFEGTHFECCLEEDIDDVVQKAEQTKEILQKSGSNDKLLGFIIHWLDMVDTLNTK